MMAQPQDNKPLNRISGWIAWAESILITLSAVAMAGIMCIVVLDVVMRYAFDAPLVWSFDLIALYLIGAVFFFALPDTMQQHGHIALDVFVPFIPLRLRHAAQSLGFGASSVLIAAISWLEFWRAQDALISDDRIAGIIPFQTWIAHAVITLGMAVLVLRCVYRSFFHGLSAVKGQDFVELPPPPVTASVSTEHGE